MKSSIIILMLVSASARLSAAETVESSLRFLNGDHISGSLDAFTTEQLVWKSPILEKPSSFLLSKVFDLTMTASLPDIGARHEASVSLTNGDLVRGQLAGISDTAVELDTWFAGRMKFNRVLVSDIKINERPDLIFRGPDGLDGWKQSEDKPSWTYRSSAFHSTALGSISRDVKLPQDSTVAFDIAWRDRLRFGFIIFSDPLSNDRSLSGYELQFQQRSITLRSCKSQRYIGSTQNAVALQENEKARIEIRGSSKTGKISLYLDGKIIENWTDPDIARGGFGSGIQFTSQGTQPIQISRIEVSAWDGETEVAPRPQFRGFNGGVGNGFGQGFNQDEDDQSEEQPKPEVTKTGRMELRNGDSIAGEVLSIEGGIITVKTSFRDVKLPVEALRSLALKPVDLETPILKNGDVRAFFPDGSSLVFRLDEVHEDAIVGFSQNFGIATFKLSAFSRIEFNLYDADFEGIRASGKL